MDKSTEVSALIDKAAGSQKSEDAVRFSQAACNAANAMCSVGNALQAAKPQPVPPAPPAFDTTF